MLSLIGGIIAVLAIAIFLGFRIKESPHFLTNKETIQTNIYDKEEVFPNCTVQVLTNTVTGEASVGWWRNDNPPIGANPDCVTDEV